MKSLMHPKLRRVFDSSLNMIDPTNGTKTPKEVVLSKSVLFLPRSITQMKKQLKEFPTDKGVAGLRSLGVTHVVMEQEVLPEHLIADYPSVAEALTVVFRDDVAGVDIYELN